MLCKLMGMVALDSGSLGEVALLFSTSRPNEVGEVVPYDGNIEPSVNSQLPANLPE